MSSENIFPYDAEAPEVSTLVTDVASDPETSQPIDLGVD
jgi:hypothetical protein